MASWTPDRIVAATTHLVRIDELIDTARDRITHRAYFSAAGALGAAVLAKRDAMAGFPPIPVDAGDEIPFLELYDFLRHLEEVVSYARAHVQGHGGHPDVPPLDEIRRLLEEARARLDGYANRHWMDDAGDRIRDAVEYLDRILGRLTELDASDTESVEGVLDRMDQFLADVSDEVNLQEAYDLLVSIDDGLEHDARLLLRRPPRERDIEFVIWSLRVTEETKHELIELILATADDGPGAEDLPPVPEDHASRQRIGAPGSAAAVHVGSMPEPVDIPAGAVRLADGPRDAERKRGRRDDDPRDELPPVIYGEEIEGGPCHPLFVRGIAARDCDPKVIPTKRILDGEIAVYIWPGSRWRGNVRGARAEIDRSFAFYANYCIQLRAKRLDIAAATEAKMVRWYAAWYQDLVRRIGGEKNLGRATFHRRHIDPFVAEMNGLQAAAVRAGARLLVVFIDEYITHHRPSLVSANQRHMHQIGINWVDRNSPYMLAHEFVHAFGKQAAGSPGRVTWNHNSPCAKALTTVGRRVRDPIDLSNRYLDLDEYNEITNNRGGNVLTRRNP